ncbi:MAG: PAS domain S-box protein [Sideroxyarcus sp.]|nr:PAS domain S-box protein [Sideroxyarcus sp.]
MHDPGSKHSSHRDILRIVLVYAVFGGVWIVLSDWAAERLFEDMKFLHVVQTLKGWLFVGVTSLLLYFLLGTLHGERETGRAAQRYTSLVNWPRWQLYLFAVAMTAATLLIRESIVISFGERPMLVLFMFPIILSAALGGLGPGAFATLLSALLAAWFALPPAGSLRIEHPYDLFQLGFLVGDGLLVSFLSRMLHDARYRSEAERQRAETSLAEKSQAMQLLSGIAESSTDAIFAKDIEGRFILFNPASERYTGKKAFEVLGRDETAIFPPDIAEKVIADNRLVMQSNKTISLQDEIPTVDGKRTFLVTKGPLHNAAGETIGLFGISRDISALKATEAALRRERDRNQRYLDSIQNIMVALDTEGRISMISRYGCELLGYRENELLGQNWFHTCLPKPEGMEKIYPLFRKLLEGNLQDTEYVENEVLCRDGQRKMIAWHNTNFTNEAGNIVGILCSGEDITQRRQTEESLRESEATYRSLFEHMLNGFAYCRMLYANGRPDDFIYLSVNEAFETQTGLKNVVGRKVSDVIPGIRETDPQLFEVYGRVAAGGKPEQLEIHVHALDLWFEISVYSPKPEHFVAVFDAITERKRAESELRKSNDLLQSVVENVPSRIFWKDRESHYLGCNLNFARDAGCSSVQELVGKSDFEMGWKDQAELYRADDKAVMESGVPKLNFEEPSTTPDGKTTWLRTSKVPLLSDSKQIIGILGVYEDITERKQAEDQLRKLSLAVEQSPESIVITDLKADIEYVNDAFVRNTGYTREEVLGRNPRILQSEKTPKHTYDALWENLKNGKSWQGEFLNKRKDGSEYVELAIISPIHQPDGRITHYLAVKKDITERKRAEAEIHRLAFYDPLTGLPNRTLLLERMAQTLALTRRAGQHSALISFNIDRFKTVNDAGGQTLGDALLKAVSERLVRLLRDDDVVARIAGDEFGILLTELAPQQQAAAHLALRVSEKIHTSLLEPFNIGHERITLTVCLGIALFPGSDEDSPLDILRRANTALHHAKTRGRGQSAFFEGTLDEIAKQRFETERELHQAVANDELRLFLQTQVDASGKVVGAEALVRWQHPQRGMVPPVAFIPIAEESNLIIEIDTWVFTQVCKLLAREDMAVRPIRIAVNISPRHFRQADFVDQIKQGLAATGADPTHLTLEVTEGMLIDNINDVIAKMSELSALGIHFSLDDFGTGYSSLSYLKRLPIHELKIDKSFVQDLTIDPEDDALVETILAVAKLMHLKVVAEGVETLEQAAFLNLRGLVIHQGYLFSKPEPAENVIAGFMHSSP